MNKDITEKDMANWEEIRSLEARLAGTERERDELTSLVAGFRNLLLPSKTVYDQQGEQWCVIDPECAQYALSETAAISLATIQAKAIEDAFAVFSAADSKYSFGRDAIVAHSEEVIDAIRNSAKESSDEG